MSGLGILEGLGGFAGGLANAIGQQQGSSDLGNALMSLYGGGSSGGSSPSLGGSSGGLGGILSSLFGGGQQSPSGGSMGQGGGGGSVGANLPPLIMPQQQQPQVQGPAAQPQAAPQMGAGPLAGAAQASAANPNVAQQPQGQMGPPQNPLNTQNGGQLPPTLQGPQQQPQQQPKPQQQQGGQGPLTLQSLIGAIRQRNPNIGGRQLAQAVEKAMPLLNMEGLQQYRGIEAQIRQEALRSTEQDRADRSSDRKQAERDRMQTSAQRIDAGNERQQKELEFKLKALDQAKTLKEAQMHATDLRSAIKDKLEATNHQIQMQYGLTDDQKAELYKQAQADAKAASDNLDKVLASKKGEDGGKGASSDDKKNAQGSQATAPKVTDEQKTTFKKQAQDAIAAGKDPAWIQSKYKELTGDDLGQ